MAQTTVRITEATRAILRDLSRDTEMPMQAVLAAAVEEYRRRRFLERVNEGYAAAKRDPAAWRALQDDVGALSAADADGLAREDWSESTRAPKRRPRQGRRK